MTATYPPRQQLRECRLYRFYVAHPATGQVVLGYVGETGRQPFERLLEHLATQPWFDTVVRWEIDPEVYWGKDAVLRAETAAIRAERPLYNVKGNERNQDRIIPPDAIRQRRARDAQQGNLRWVHPDDRGPKPPAAPRPPARKRRSPLQRKLARAAKVAGVWLGIWFATALAGMVVATRWQVASGWHAFEVGAAVLPATLTLVLAGAKTRRRRRRILRWMAGRSG